MGIVFTEGSGLNDSIFAKSEAPIRLFLEKRGEAWEQESILKNIFWMGQSESAMEKFTGMTAMNGFMPVGENGAHPHDEMQESFSKILQHETWKDQFSVSREMVDDAKLIDFRKRPEQFVSGYYRTRENFGAALVAGAIAGNTSVSFRGRSFKVTGADELCVFHKAHPAKVYGDAQSNCFADAFSTEALGKAETAMQNFYGDNGEVLDISPDTIVIPNLHSLKDAVFAAVGSDRDPDSGNNKFNYLFGRWKVQIWPYLNRFITAGSAPWMLLDSRYNEQAGGLVWLDRTELEVTPYVDKGTDAAVFGGYARFCAGFNDWRAVAVGGVTGGTTL